jgi:hypothetical protein
MKYLVVCAHRKSIVDNDDPRYDVRQAHRCSSCVGFNLKMQRWSFKDVRVYEATDKEIAIVGMAKQAPAFQRPEPVKGQLDWVQD